MAQTAQNRRLALKVAVFDWIMTHVPPLRRYREYCQGCERLVAQLQGQLLELHRERETLIRGISRLLDERAAHPPG
jgi:hypothetical protein